MRANFNGQKKSEIFTSPGLPPFQANPQQLTEGFLDFLEDHYRVRPKLVYVAAKHRFLLRSNLFHPSNNKQKIPHSFQSFHILKLVDTGRIGWSSQKPCWSWSATFCSWRISMSHLRKNWPTYPTYHTIISLSPMFATKTLSLSSSRYCSPSKTYSSKINAVTIWNPRAVYT